METAEKDKEAFSWLTRAWDDYTSNLPLLLPVLLTQAALTAGSFYLIGRFHSLFAAAPYMLFVVTPVATGANLVYIKITRGSGARFLDLFGAFPVYHRAIGVSLLLGLLTLAGTLLLIVPGILLYLAYCFSEYAAISTRGQRCAMSATRLNSKCFCISTTTRFFLWICVPQTARSSCRS